MLGQVNANPGSITPHKKYKAEVYVLSKEEGGRHTPFFTNYRPQFYFRTTDVTGTVKLAQGVEMVMPGDNVTVDIRSEEHTSELQSPCNLVCRLLLEKKKMPEPSTRVRGHPVDCHATVVMTSI